jgi:hypothetical protein
MRLGAVRTLKGRLTFKTAKTPPVKRFHTSGRNDLTRLS